MIFDVLFSDVHQIERSETRFDVTRSGDFANKIKITVIIYDKTALFGWQNDFSYVI